MRKILMMFLLAAGIAPAFGQEKVTLTKGETISYLNKKFAEALQHKYKTDYITSSSITIKDCSVTYTVVIGSDLKDRPYRSSTSNSARDERLEFTFNPMHINEVKILPGDQGGTPVGRMVIKLISKVGKCRSVVSRYKTNSRNYRGAWNGSAYPLLTEYYYTWEPTQDETETMMTMSFFYLQSDPDNFKKIQKAFEHLKSLCKAEDDPFGE